MNSPDSNKYSRRPKRLPSLFPWVSPLYFITFNTHHRISILTRVEVHQAFIVFCRRAEEFGIRVGDYVIMPNHLHCLVALPELGEPTLSGWVGSLKNILGRTLRGLGMSNPHWQEGFFDHVVRDEAGWQDKINYMRQNPVRANLCKDSTGWPYQGQICDDLGRAKQIQRRRHSAVSTREEEKSPQSN